MPDLLQSENRDRAFDRGSFFWPHDKSGGKRSFPAPYQRTADASESILLVIRDGLSCAQQVRNFFEMIPISKYCIVYSDKENRQKPAVVVAQLVERDKTGLGKDLNSNPFHQMCVFAGSNPASAAAFKCFPSQKAALLWENKSWQRLSQQ